jgi:AraC-like DNA-binding protein
MLAAPRMHRPVSALADHTEIIGHWHANVGYRSRALPRGAITLIIDVGRRQQLDFYAADGRTRLSVPPAFLTGSHTASYVSEMTADEPTMAARFSILENFLLARPWSSARRHPGVAAALAAIEDNPSIRMADIRDLVGMSTKRLIALFRAEVGLSPKAYARIRRFQAALRLLGTGTSGARIAAEVGYFDQAHFVREFRSFTGMTPTQYAEQRILLPSHVPVAERVRHKYPRPLAAARS